MNTTFLLTPTLFASNQALAAGFGQQYRENPNEEVHQSLCGDLSQISSALQRMAPDLGNDLSLLVGDFQKASTPFYERMIISGNIQTFLQNRITAPLLAGLRILLNIPEPASTETALAAYNPLLRRGHQLQSHDRIENASLRKGLEDTQGAPGLLQKARENLESAYRRSEEGYLHSFHECVMNHVEALISGEVGAPETLRWAVVQLIAKSPEHAAGYAELLCSDADMAEILESGELWTHIPNPEKILPMKLKIIDKTQSEPPAQAKPEQDSAHMDFGTTVEILDEIRKIYRSPEHVASLRHLAQTMPATFGHQAIQDLLAAGSVAAAALNLSPKDRLLYLADCQLDGRIPSGYLTVRNRYSFDLSLPPSFLKTDLSEPQPLSAYVLGPGFQAASGEWNQPTESAVRKAIAAFLENRGDRAGGWIREKIRLIECQLPGHPEKAMRGLLALRAYLLSQSIKKHEAFGLKRLSDFDDRFKSYLEQNLLAQAQVLVDYAISWSERIQAIISRIDDLRVDLTLFDAEDSLRQFDATVKELLSKGSMDHLRAFADWIEDQARRNPVRAKDKLTQLSSRVRMTAMTVLELLRVLLAADAAQARRLAPSIPSVAGLLEGGSVTVENVRRVMKNEGLPMPGDGRSPALPSGRALGVRHSPKELSPHNIVAALNAVNVPE